MMPTRPAPSMRGQFDHQNTAQLLDSVGLHSRSSKKLQAQKHEVSTREARKQRKVKDPNMREVLQRASKPPPTWTCHASLVVLAAPQLQNTPVQFLLASGR